MQGAVMASSPPSPGIRPQPEYDSGKQRRSVITLLVISLRPEQWTKNLLVFAGALFGGRLVDPGALGFAGATFVIFCALSGAIYLFNDIADRDADQRHPLKRLRPIASGQLVRSVALAAAAVLGLAGVAAAFWIRPHSASSRRRTSVC
jgi:4-hydroxybenzoate polyprenyltransferase